jgi:hypothetical protein
MLQVGEFRKGEETNRVEKQFLTISSGKFHQCGGREKSVHFHILYCQYNFLEVDRRVRAKFIPNLNILARNVSLGREASQLILFMLSLTVID